MTTELTSLHFLHNPKCDCGIVESYASKKQAVQATRRYRERCLGHRKKARKLHAPYPIPGHQKFRKSLKDKKSLKPLGTPQQATIDELTARIDPLIYDPRAESVNGEMSALQLRESFLRAGREFAANLDGFHIFKVERKAFLNGEYTGVLDPRLWTEKLYDFRDRMGVFAGSLLENVSMAEVPLSPKCSRQFRATRASAIYFWWRICRMIEDFCADCGEVKQYGLGVEWEHERFVQGVLKMKKLVASMWYALGMVLWDDMKKFEGFRWNVIHIHLNGKSTKLPGLKEYTISQEVFSKIPNTNQLPCLSFDKIKISNKLYERHKGESHIDTTVDVLAKIVIINQEASNLLKHSTICFQDLQQSMHEFFKIADGPNALSILKNFEELVTDVDGPDGLSLLECLSDLVVDFVGPWGLTKLEGCADVVAHEETCQRSDANSSPSALELGSDDGEGSTRSSTTTQISKDECIGCSVASASSDQKKLSGYPARTPIAPAVVPIFEGQLLLSPTMTPSTNFDRINCSPMSASSGEKLGNRPLISPTITPPSTRAESIRHRSANPPNEKKLEKPTTLPIWDWDLDIPLSKDPVEAFINSSLERPTLPIVMHMRTFRQRQGETRVEAWLRQSQEQLDIASEVLRTLDVDAILRWRERCNGDGEVNRGENKDVEKEIQSLKEAWLRCCMGGQR